MPDLETRLTRCFVAVFPELDPAAAPTVSMTSMSGWDSIASVMLIGVVEEEFGRQIPPEDLEQFVSYESIRSYLKAPSSPGAS